MVVFRPLKPDVNTDTYTSYPLDSMIFFDRNRSISNLFTMGTLFHQEFVEMLHFVQNVQLHYNNKLTVSTVYCLNLRLIIWPMKLHGLRLNYSPTFLNFHSIKFLLMLYLKFTIKIKSCGLFLLISDALSFHTSFPQNYSIHFGSFISLGLKSI